MIKQAQIVATKPSMFAVQRGQVWQVGPHRLMCGDGGSVADVATLMAGQRACLVFTSPPYDNLRAYTQKLECWKTLISRVCKALPAHSGTQVLFNIGLAYQRSQWSWYWVDLIRAMEAENWKRTAWIVWDKISGIPGLPTHGKPTPQHEFIFAFSRNKRILNRIFPCKHAGRSATVNTRQADGGFRYDKPKRVIVGHKKIIGSVVSLAPERNNKTGHPATFPVALPRLFIDSYTDAGQTVYDPFCGSGTSLIAAEKSGRVGYGMEIAPQYVEIALQRWAALYPAQPPTLLAAAA